MENTSNLIKNANEFLDSLNGINNKLKEIVDKIKNKTIDKTELSNIISTLEKNLEILQDLKSKMEFLEFDSPYKNVGKLKGSYDSEGLQEIASYSTYLRRIASEKKGILERVRHALVAHKIALAHLTEDIGNINLPPNLPLDGSYKKIMFEFPPYLVTTYKEFLDILEPKGRGILTSYTVSLIVIDKGKREFKRVKVEDKNYEKYIKEKFGNAIITSIKRNFSKNKIIDDQYVRRVLAIGYLNAYKDEIERAINEKIDKLLNEEEKKYLNKYLELCLLFREEADISGGILDVRCMEERKLKELELKEILEKEGLYKDGEPIELLKKAIKIKNELSKEISKDILIKKFSEDVFKFYLYKTPDERARSNLFPSIMITPQKGFLSWMKVEGVDCINVLDLKFKLEEELPKYQIPLKNIGGVALYLIHDWKTVEKFNFNKKDIEDLLKKIALIEPIKEILKDKNVDISKLEKFGKVKKEKTKKFLDLLSGL
ncbi:hypothetical protein JH146_0735 [Methanocaldococcus bathoardescens]|uniref:Uncharacterized protein n=1 Tax=Methanocaldococcus bathoardescens TaxID=1301915 RepID=A0A076LFH6_9EURY|nr:DUF530 family protein [Methanocaldococcus bathoardescens]AIJ05582.1 hypothetical protein JH146_0735 [Methanocaldococcus bathoardescens]